MLKQINILLISLSWLILAINQQDDIIKLNDDDKHVLERSKTSNVKISMLDGYKLLVFLENANINWDVNDYLIIKPGAKLNDDKSGVLVTHEATNKFFLIYSNQVFIKFKSSQDQSFFKLSYQRTGNQLTTTTEIPTTLTPWPLPPENLKVSTTVYVYGKSADDYENPDILKQLKSSISCMATKFCTDSDYNLEEPVTTENVLVKFLRQCTYDWPESSQCIELNFALPVIFNKSQPDDYELSGTNLDTMWSRYARTCFNKTEFKVYDVPENQKTVTIWLVLTCSILIAFLLVLLFPTLLRKCCSLSDRIRQIDMTPLRNSKSRSSVDSLRPHYFQSTPPMFEPELDDQSAYSKQNYQDLSSEDEQFSRASDRSMVHLKTFDNQGFVETES